MDGSIPKNAGTTGNDPTTKGKEEEIGVCEKNSDEEEKDEDEEEEEEEDEDEEDTFWSWDENETKKTSKKSYPDPFSFPPRTIELSKCESLMQIFDRNWHFISLSSSIRSICPFMPPVCVAMLIHCSSIPFYSNIILTHILQRDVYEEDEIYPASVDHSCAPCAEEKEEEHENKNDTSKHTVKSHVSVSIDATKMRLLLCSLLSIRYYISAHCRHPQCTCLESFHSRSTGRAIKTGAQSSPSFEEGGIIATSKIGDYILETSDILKHLPIMPISSMSILFPFFVGISCAPPQTRSYVIHSLHFAISIRRPLFLEFIRSSQESSLRRSLIPPVISPWLSLFNSLASTLHICLLREQVLHTISRSFCIDSLHKCFMGFVQGWVTEGSTCAVGALCEGWKVARVSIPPSSCVDGLGESGRKIKKDDKNMTKGMRKRNEKGKKRTRNKDPDHLVSSIPKESSLPKRKHRMMSSLVDLEEEEEEEEACGNTSQIIQKREERELNPDQGDRSRIDVYNGKIGALFSLLSFMKEERREKDQLFFLSTSIPTSELVAALDSFSREINPFHSVYCSELDIIFGNNSSRQDKKTLKEKIGAVDEEESSSSSHSSSFDISIVRKQAMSNRRSFPEAPGTSLRKIWRSVRIHEGGKQMSQYIEHNTSSSSSQPSSDKDEDKKCTVAPSKGLASATSLDPSAVCTGTINPPPGFGKWECLPEGGQLSTIASRRMDQTLSVALFPFQWHLNMDISGGSSLGGIPQGGIRDPDSGLHSDVDWMFADVRQLQIYMSTCGVLFPSLIYNQAPVIDPSETEHSSSEKISEENALKSSVLHDSDASIIKSNDEGDDIREISCSDEGEDVVEIDKEKFVQQDRAGKLTPMKQIVDFWYAVSLFPSRPPAFLFQDLSKIVSHTASANSPYNSRLQPFRHLYSIIIYVCGGSIPIRVLLRSMENFGWNFDKKV
ncbi:hypothetical protein ADUPG1_009228 [Aduncisulcus paluster]|uniref:Uncharacterized protein n=1 Tax=Aduncisulcus paluster TaxID=2918883 RepID=A0ABQ5KYS6_9EUKA|nr:hypothetical protein ADUPG1_009228 [Aduncisulcus paluster]